MRLVGEMCNEKRRRMMRSREIWGLGQRCISWRKVSSIYAPAGARWTGSRSEREKTSV